MENPQVANNRLNNYYNIFNKIKEASSGRNFVFSPASLFLALGMVAEGLSPAAKAEISQIMGFGETQVIDNTRLY